MATPSDVLGRYAYAFAVAAFLSFVAIGLIVQVTAASSADFRATLFRFGPPVTVIGGLVGIGIRRVLSR